MPPKGLAARAEQLATLQGLQHERLVDPGLGDAIATIKNSVEKIFNVKVTKVNTMNRQGKHKRLRSMNYGMTSAWKRAVVTLKEGEKIDLT